MSRSPRPRAVLAALAVLGLVASMSVSAGAIGGGTLTNQPPMLALDASTPAGSKLLPIINSGETIGNFTFEGIPDGLGLMPGKGFGTVDVFVNHEQSHVPFAGFADLQDSSVSRLTLNRFTGGVLNASVALPASAGFMRFCSATMAGPREGLERYLFFTNEETNDIVPVPAGAPYGADPSLAPNRQGGYAVVLDPKTGTYVTVPGMGRHNHENDMVVPGRWDDKIAVLSGDDTFFTSPLPDWSQLYLYLAGSERDITRDRGHLYGFQVTGTQSGPVDPSNAKNGANDYGDIVVGDNWSGRFIRVPDDIARGTTSAHPQDGLEDWANANNVFQFIRVEDTAYDPNHPRVVYIADTGDGRMIPDAAAERLTRGPSGTLGSFPNGRIFRMEFDRHDPRKVMSFSILRNNDLGGRGNLAEMHQPDNLGTSRNSLMVQEDTSQMPGARVWRYDFASGTWSVVAAVNNGTVNESSGIVDASRWFGPGWWLLDVQAHDTLMNQTPGPPGVTLKREGGQLVLMKIPGS